MKIAAVISRLLLGLGFTIFGLNGFLHFMPMQPPGGLAGQFMGILYVSHYLVAIFLVQLAGGVLLLVNRFVPLALALLAPVIVNILLFHLLLFHPGAQAAIVVTVLWLIVFAARRASFAGVFAARG
jgi:peptidoglycan biosynthesis protein MviN/MurJ (putative lipid II flippase)